VTPTLGEAEALDVGMSTRARTSALVPNAVAPILRVLIVVPRDESTLNSLEASFHTRFRSRMSYTASSLEDLSSNWEGYEKKLIYPHGDRWRCQWSAVSGPTSNSHKVSNHKAYESSRTSERSSREKYTTCKKVNITVCFLIEKPVFNLVEIELNSVLRVVCRMGTVPAPNRPASFLGKISRLRTAVRDRRPTNIRRGTTVLAIGIVGAITCIGFTGSSAFGAAAIDLGSATPDAVVAGTTITNTGNSVLTGDISLSPGTSIVGFPPGTASGTTDAADALSLAAQTSATAAYVVAASKTPFTTLAGGTVGGLTLSPGVYQASSAMQLTGPLTLNAGGDASAVFIFQAGSTLTTASASSVVLEGGAQACNVYWQVGSSATLGSTTSFVGTILALASVTLNSGASVDGRVFAQTGAVTLNDNVITVPTCSTPSTPPTTTTTTTPTNTTTAATTPTTTTKAPVTTVATKNPGGTAAPGAKHGGTGGGSGTGVTPGSSSTIIPKGAPSTGEGGTAGSGPSPLGLIGLGAIVVSASATSVAIRARRRR
jgi:Ice-binding-like